MRNALPALLALSLFFSFAFAQPNLSVVEVSTSVYDKPLQGFRFLIPLPEPVFREVIHQYYSAPNQRALDLEQVVLFDQVLYPEVSQELPLTLFFLLNPLGENSTQVTVCAQYEHNRCITVAETPDLAMRLLMDLSRLTASTQHGTLDISPLFKNTLPQEIRARYEDRRERMDQQLYMSSGPLMQSHVTQNVLIHASPFSATPAVRLSHPADDQPIAAMLSDRFSQYIGQSPAAPPTSSVAMLALRDSFEQVLRQERTLCQRQGTEIQHLTEQLAALDPESQQAQQQLKAYKQRIAELLRKETDMQAREAYVLEQQKLNEQRLSYLIEYEQSRDALVLLNRLRELEAAMQRLEFAQFEAMRN